MNKYILGRVSGIIPTVTLVVSFFTLYCTFKSVNFTWEKPDDSRVAGYNLYCGISATDSKATPF